MEFRDFPVSQTHLRMNYHAVNSQAKTHNIALLVIQSVHIQVPGQIRSNQHPLARECSDSHLHA